MPSDWENPIDRRGWNLWGVVYGAFGGEGGTVAGGALWVRNREAFGSSGGETFRAAKDGVYLTIRPVTPVQGCKAGFTLKLDPQGRLYANGGLVGRAKDITGR